MSERLPTLGYSPLTGTTYVLLRNGQKRAVPEPELVTVIAAYLDDHHLSVTKPDGTVVRYGVLDEDGRPDADLPAPPEDRTDLVVMGYWVADCLDAQDQLVLRSIVRRLANEVAGARHSGS